MKTTVIRITSAAAFVIGLAVAQAANARQLNSQVECRFIDASTRTPSTQPLWSAEELGKFSFLTWN
jgi:hypothetical protein